MTEIIPAEQPPAREPLFARVRSRCAAWFTTHRRAVVLVSVSLVVAGLLAVGFGIGQLVMPRTVVAGEVVTVDASELLETTTVASMSDLQGLDEQTARRVITDAGLDVDVVTVETPAAGPAGIVTAQVPVAGGALAPTVTLTLSVQTVVPDLAGVSIADARSQLEALGTVVIVERVIDPAAVEGSVVSSAPQAGAVLDRIITLGVADPGEALSLALVDRVDSDHCTTMSSGAINGIPVQDSVTCEPGTGASSIEWSLGRHAAALEATIGVLDIGEQGSATVRVIGDGVVLSEVRAEFGTTTNIRVDVHSVLRLRIEVIGATGDPTVVIGDGRLLATPEGIQLIGAS